MSNAIRILLCEPSESTARMLRALLESQGYLLTTVDSGPKLLGELRSDDIGVIILAIDIPGVPTLELVESVLRVRPDVQVIISTSGADVDSAIRSLRAGVFDVLTKDPIDAPRALAIVKRAVDRCDLDDENALSAARVVFEHGDAEQLPQALVEETRAIVTAVSVRLIVRTPSGGFEICNSASEAKVRPIGRETDIDVGPALTDDIAPLRLPEDRDDPRLQDVEISPDVNCLIVPIVRKSSLCGYLTCHRDIAARRFSKRELALATVVAAICALALEGRTSLWDLRRRHQTLLGAWKRIVEAQRMEAMGRQAASLAMEVQNPIAYVEGHMEFFRSFVEAVERGDTAAVNTQAAKQSIEDALSGLHRIGLAAAEMSRLARARDDVEFELGKAIDSAIRMCDNLRSEVVVRIDDVILKGNIGKFSQAVTHLLVNADEAMNECDTRRISIYTAPVVGDRVELVIEDHGHGISDDHMARITEPFFTTKDEEAGVGLGLSTARDVVEQIGGSLRVASEPERGTKVSLLLPVHGAPEEIMALGGHSDGDI